LNGGGGRGRGGMSNVESSMRVVVAWDETR
jgi:hypothetical protein